MWRKNDEYFILPGAEARVPTSAAGGALFFVCFCFSTWFGVQLAADGRPWGRNPQQLAQTPLFRLRRRRGEARAFCWRNKIGDRKEWKWRQTKAAGDVPCLGRVVRGGGGGGDVPGVANKRGLGQPRHGRQLAMHKDRARRMEESLSVLAPRLAPFATAARAAAASRSAVPRLPRTAKDRQGRAGQRRLPLAIRAEE